MLAGAEKDAMKYPNDRFSRWTALGPAVAAALLVNGAVLWGFDGLASRAAISAVASHSPAAGVTMPLAFARRQAVPAPAARQA